MTSLVPKPLSSYLYETRFIILEMLEQRGFQVDHYKNFTEAEMNAVAREIKTQSPEPIVATTDKEHIEVHYLLDKNNPTQKTMETFVGNILSKRDEELEKLDNTLIVITKSKPSQSVQECIVSLYEKTNTFVQIFPIRTLTYNVTKHTFVPKHTRLPISIFENEMKETYALKSPEELPHILESDPVAKFIGLRPGDICQIIRPSLSAGVHTTFRYCVPNSFP